MNAPLTSLAQRVISWQRQHGRHGLPWQNTQDPYRVWLSEIMLQQTQVATVIGYFERFTNSFPNVESLANASIEDVLLHWAGLGYYARARNLHACAKQVVELWNGKFPTQADTLQTLPGIGPSTAAAIAAFCFGQRTPILDGNVKRVYCRFFGVEGDPSSRLVTQQLWQHAHHATPSLELTVTEPDAMARFTQGLMDLGATCCTRRNPDCIRCPLMADCVANLTHRTHTLPSPRMTRVKPERSTMMLIISAKTAGFATDHLADNKPAIRAILLQKRPSKGIWGGLWSLPECQADDGLAADLNRYVDPDDGKQSAKLKVIQWCTKHGIQKPTLLRMAAFRHTFTHFHLHIQPWSIEINDFNHIDLSASNDTLQWVSVDQLHLFGMPAPVQNLLMNTK